MTSRPATISAKLAETLGVKGGDRVAVSQGAGSVVLFLLPMLWVTRWIARRQGMPVEDEIVAVFCGSKKSLANGIPMAKILFAGHPALGLLVLPLMISVAYLTLWERKLIGWMQIRIGPNRVGPFGLLQPIADGLKLFLKEIIVPTSSSKGLFILAPIMALMPALAAWAVVPFAPEVVLADINVGLLYVLAISSLGVYGVVLSGWASNSKYPFYSAIRASAQMISYEVSIGFILICVVLWAGSFNLTAIVESQKGYYGFLNGNGFNPLLFPMAVER